MQTIVRRLRAPTGWLMMLQAALAVSPASVLAARALAPLPAVVVQYQQATDLFIVLDNLPDWLPGYTAGVYAADWQSRFGFSADDRKLLDAYGAFRKRTSPAAKQDDETAAPSVLISSDARETDPLTLQFLQAASFKQGVAAATRNQAPVDRAMLNAYFARFAPRASTLLHDASAFDRQRHALQRDLASARLDPFVAEMRRFYDAGSTPNFQARFVGWPDRDMTQAKIRGRYMLLQSNPDGDSAMDWTPIVMHEFAHYLSAGLASERRVRLSAAFLRACPSAAQLRNPLNALEEPLAIYWGQYRFAYAVRGSSLSPDESWYVQPDADRIAKAIAHAFPAAAPAPALDDPRLLSAAADACSPRAGK